MDTHEALICLSFLSMTALALQTFRARAGASRPRARSLAEAFTTRRAAEPGAECESRAASAPRGAKMD